MKNIVEKKWVVVTNDNAAQKLKQAQALITQVLKQNPDLKTEVYQALGISLTELEFAEIELAAR